VKPLPEEFYFAFEIALGQSLYYRADEDPEFLKPTFAYPNEIEGAVDPCNPTVARKARTSDADGANLEGRQMVFKSDT
jgi:hypothetical protein